MDQLNETRTAADGQPQHAAPRRPGLLIAMAAAMAMLVVTCAAFFFLLGRGDVRLGSGSADPSPATSAAFSASPTTAPAQATTTTAPAVRHLGILIMQNIGTGESAGQANRVYFLGRDAKPGPGLHIVPAAIQPVDVDPRPEVRRAVNLPYREIIARAKRGERFHPSPQVVARPGERVEIVIQNRDRILHSVTFDEADFYEDVGRRQTKTYEFTVPRLKKPEAFFYYCRWRQLGMDGLFVVKGPPVPK
jgi:plastocyanin